MLGLCRWDKQRLAKELQMSKEKKKVSNKINNILFGYNPQYKINVHRSMLIEIRLNKYVNLGQQTNLPTRKIPNNFCR